MMLCLMIGFIMQIRLNVGNGSEVDIATNTINLDKVNFANGSKLSLKIQV